MLKAIIFDIDGVLYGVRTGDVALYRRLLAKGGYEVPEDDYIEQFTHLPLWEGIKYLIDSNDVDEINRVRDGLLLPGQTHGDFISAPANLRQHLESLSKQYRLAIVTSKFRRSAHEFLEHHKIQELFEVVVAYEDTIDHKPHPEPLLAALEAMNLKPDKAVYVGDTESDIAAATDAKMQCIHLSPRQAPGSTVWIKSFDQILEGVAQLA